MMMNDDYEENKNTCPHCNAKMVRYTHALNLGMALGLKALADAGGESHIKHLGLDFNQRSNFQKMKYWR